MRRLCWLALLVMGCGATRPDTTGYIRPSGSFIPREALQQVTMVSATGDTLHGYELVLGTNVPLAPGSLMSRGFDTKGWVSIRYKNGETKEELEIISDPPRFYDPRGYGRSYGGYGRGFGRSNRSYGNYGSHYYGGVYGTKPARDALQYYTDED